MFALVDFFSVVSEMFLSGEKWVALLTFLLFFFLLMFVLPIFLWWKLNKRVQQRSFKVLQLLLRANAGPDELLIRELEAKRHQCVKKPSAKESPPDT